MHLMLFVISLISSCSVEISRTKERSVNDNFWISIVSLNIYVQIFVEECTFASLIKLPFPFRFSYLFSPLSQSDTNGSPKSCRVMFKMWLRTEISQINALNDFTVVVHQ